MLKEISDVVESRQQPVDVLERNFLSELGANEFRLKYRISTLENTPVGASKLDYLLIGVGVLVEMSVKIQYLLVMPGSCRKKYIQLGRSPMWSIREVT